MEICVVSNNQDEDSMFLHTNRVKCGNFESTTNTLHWHSSHIFSFISGAVFFFRPFFFSFEQ